METNNNFQQPIQTDNNTIPSMKNPKKSGFPWIVVIIAVLILGGLTWYFLGAGNNTEIIDEVEPQVVSEQIESETQYDERGLPILGPNAPIDNVGVVVSESFPTQVGLAVSGSLPNGCTYLNSPAQVRDGATFYVSLTTRTEGENCTQALVPYERNIILDVAGLPAARYNVNINGMKYAFDIAQENTVNFEAGFDK